MKKTVLLLIISLLLSVFVVKAQPAVQIDMGILTLQGVSYDKDIPRTGGNCFGFRLVESVILKVTPSEPNGRVIGLWEFPYIGKNGEFTYPNKTQDASMSLILDPGEYRMLVLSNVVGHKVNITLSPVNQDSEPGPIRFAYDASGNRIERTIVLSRSATKSASPEILTDHVAERSIKIYPNPTQGHLKVEIANTEDIKDCIITIHTMATGQQVYRKKANFPVSDIDISGRPSGIYIMRINIDGKYTSWKIIKQ